MVIRALALGYLADVCLKVSISRQMRIIPLLIVVFLVRRLLLAFGGVFKFLLTILACLESSRGQLWC